ncbi:MAG: hypothetical protein ACK56F_16505 [bacterium]
MAIAWAASIVRPSIEVVCLGALSFVRTSRSRSMSASVYWLKCQ